MGKNEGKISSDWHPFKDWNDAPDCDGVIVTIENRFVQRFVTEAWWTVDCDCKCKWYTNNIKYAEDWEAGNFHLSHNWKVVAWRYRLEPYKEDWVIPVEGMGDVMPFNLNDNPIVAFTHREQCNRCLWQGTPRCVVYGKGMDGELECSFKERERNRRGNGMTSDAEEKY